MYLRHYLDYSTQAEQLFKAAEGALRDTRAFNERLICEKDALAMQVL